MGTAVVYFFTANICPRLAKVKSRFLMDECLISTALKIVNDL